MATNAPIPLPVAFAQYQPLLLFDGVCNLCNGAVQFILTHEKKPGVIRFASLQSPVGQQLLAEAFNSKPAPDSLLLLENGFVYSKGQGAIRLANYLKQPYKWLGVFSILPKPLTNIGYNVVAQNRYRWFGKKESCWLPTPELKSRFVSV